MAIHLDSNKITPEVRQLFESPRRPELVPVIIAVAPGSAAAVFEALGEERRTREDHSDHYVYARFATRQQLEAFVAEHDEVIEKVWHDKPVRSLADDVDMDAAEKTSKALAARNLFDVAGGDVTWAVLDSGVNFDHVQLRDNESGYSGNFTDEDDPGDLFGHGSHVAGIITAMAPEVEIANYKVLNSKGEGSDSWIIQAMWSIRKLNLTARKLLIHGANLSLGGTVPVGSYGVGASPICQEANRLMRSGVVVCVAAGNSGHVTLLVPDGDQVGFHDSFMDLSIEDPANAEDVITVGSVHAENPHTYGVSFFSSKGPTGDGRLKPDIVAPGEKIWSADHESDDEYVEMSGTSMATPVVSGVVALLLSRCPELKGHSRRVKELVMETAVDLRRDHCFQGAGMVDALRLLQAP